MRNLPHFLSWHCLRVIDLEIYRKSLFEFSTLAWGQKSIILIHRSFLANFSFVNIILHLILAKVSLSGVLLLSRHVFSGLYWIARSNHSCRQLAHYARRAALRMLYLQYSQRSAGHYSKFRNLPDSCGWANSIRIRYVWTRIFLNLQQKISGFEDIRIRMDGALMSRTRKLYVGVKI